MATYWENSCTFGLRYVSWYKCLIVSLFFSHLGFWSGNLFLIAPFPDPCLLVPFTCLTFSSYVAPINCNAYQRKCFHGTFPSEPKHAKVCLIHKGVDKNDPSNYRPISILPTISIFEKHVNQHLIGFLNKYKIIHEHRFGFRQKDSCCQPALVKLVDQSLSCIDKGDCAMLVGFLNAFDLVDHSILIDKLACESGLTDFSNVLSGVPQKDRSWGQSRFYYL